MFWRSWLSSIVAAALVFGTRLTGGNLILTGGLLAAAVLVASLGAWWVHSAHKKAQSATTRSASSPVQHAVASEAKQIVPAATAGAHPAPATTEVTAAFAQVAEQVSAIAASAQAEQDQVQELWSLVGRVNSLLSDLHQTTANQLPDLDRSRDIARQVATEAGEMAEVVRQARQGATERRAAASGVQQAIGDITRGMDAIREAVEASDHRIQDLSQQSSQIGEIVKMIRAIADQTNMLALNAAIEAARAGAAGRGFAVVADEVRKLADRSRNATRQIEELVTNIREGTDAATHAMDEGQAQVSQGATLVQGAQGAITNILASAESLDQIVDDFGTRAEATSGRMTEVLAAVEEVTRLAHQNNDTMKQLAEADWFSHAIKRTEQLAKDLHEASRAAQDRAAACAAQCR